MKSFIAVAIAMLAVFLGFLIYRGVTYGVKPVDYEAPALIDLDAGQAAQRLAAAIRIPTISYLDRDEIDYTQFEVLRRHFEETYPKVHEAMQREIINGYSLLFRWPGRDADLKPILVMGHQDVVPIEAGTADQWDHPPFAGDIADGFIWGRGALDDKVTVVGLLEAAEALIERDFKPERTVYFAFGHDEEIGGKQGAVKISETLEARGIEPAFILDEGMVIVKGVIPVVPEDQPVALVALAEKGYISLKLTATASSGHSARPPGRTAVGALARAITALEVNQFEPDMTKPVQAMFRYLGPELNFGRRVLFGNQWLFEEYLLDQLVQSTAVAPLVRTTTAPTMLEAGIKDNVLPTQALAVVNFRIRPGQTVDDVEQHVRRVVNDPDIRIEPLEDVNIINPSPVASVDGHGFKTIYRSIREVFPEALVTPSMTLGATDSRHYQNLTPEIYRFVPSIMTREDLSRVHGKNERLGVDNFGQVVRFYARLIQNAAGAGGPR